MELPRVMSRMWNVEGRIQAPVAVDVAVEMPEDEVMASG